jgi:hypothetical protein
MIPTDYETEDFVHPLHEESFALAKKFMNRTDIDALSSSLYFYPSDFGLGSEFNGKVIVVTVEIQNDQLPSA